LDEKLGENKQLIKGIIFGEVPRNYQISANPLAGKYLHKGKNIFIVKSVCVSKIIG
jgi:hypothetical protein